MRASRSGGAPGRRSTTRSTATPGRRCRRFTSAPRCSRRSCWRSRAATPARSAGPTRARSAFALVYLGEHYVTDLVAGARPGRPRCVAASRWLSRSSRRSAGRCSGWSESPTDLSAARTGTTAGACERDREVDVWPRAGRDRGGSSEQDARPEPRRRVAAAARSAVDDYAEPSFFEDPKRLLQTLLIVAVARRRRSTSLLPEHRRTRRRDQQARRTATWSLVRRRRRLRVSPCSPAYVALFRGVIGERVHLAGRSATRSPWPGWRRRGCSRPAAPAASCSPTGRCARRGCSATRRPRGWSPSSSSSTRSTWSR